MENQFYDQQYLKLCSIADKEGRAFARTALESFARSRKSTNVFKLAVLQPLHYGE